jgi:hypothetical protein
VKERKRERREGGREGGREKKREHCQIIGNVNTQFYKVTFN